MNKPVIISEKPISMAEIKNMLAHIRKRDDDLNFRATKTEDYLNQVENILGITKAKELKQKLEELNVPRLKEEHVIKIVDILPETVDDLKLILQGYIVTISQENAKKIVDLVKEYTTSKK